MATTLHLLVFFIISFAFVFNSESEKTFRPRSLVLPVQKDGATGLHVAKIQKRTPLQQLPSVVDLNGRFLWADCEHNYLSSTYQAPRCHSTLCSKAGSHYCHTCSTSARPGCHNNTCGIVAVNPVTRHGAIGEIASDVLSIQSTQGSNPGPLVKVPSFLFTCAPSFLLQNGFPYGAQGVVGFGHTPIALPTQLASHFGFPPKFAFCLSPDPVNGVIFIGDGPYIMLPGIDLSQSLRFTPLTVSPRGEYFIEVTSIKINGKVVPLNISSSSIQKTRVGGTLISTTAPYTAFKHSIYTTLVQFFANELSQVPQVTPISPFALCFNAQNITSTRLGAGVPTIELMLHGPNVSWSIFGANSMVMARPGVLCLAFVDGGLNPLNDIVIGIYQFQDKLLQFDLAKSRLGLSPTLLSYQTTCGNFNFTSTP
ncbi:Xylanase inhibitor, N-terminal [Dillenia turbinata]|uniref:Xylanase inhibitor, N-terminal n=1 Tax=Dillenia turbinata TaxID=194707 RepID=A0AAN8UJ68_9MAGN